MKVLQKFFRRKFIDSDETRTELHRVLSTVDLTLLGIGSTLGIGIYVLAGSVAKANAGPAVVLSFFVAAFASVLAGLCYAEFGARVPKAGSAYVYSYVCVGEIIAFIVGWNLIMEYVIGVASVAKGYSGYVDSLTTNNAMRHAFESVGVLDVSFLGKYFDFFAFGITIALTLLLMFGVKESSLVNSIFTVLNLLVVLFVIIAGGIYAKFSNWTIDPHNYPNCTNASNTGEIGSGGFAPFGFAGIMAGAATCFYGFIGFDVIATTGEEAKNPKRSIPISIVLSLLFVFLAYFGISTVMTMMLPYYCQDKDAPLPFAFEYQGFIAGKWIVNVGALLGLATSLLGSMFPMPRVIYAMAKDGLLFQFLAYVHPTFQTPLWATLIGGVLGAIMAGLFNLESLIDMMSIGTLTAYTLVAICVLMLRYRKSETGEDDTSIDDSIEPITASAWFSQIFNSKSLKVPTKLSSTYTLWTIVLYCILCFAFCGTAILGEKNLSRGEWELIVPISVIGVALLFLLLSLSAQPTSRISLSFKVPLLPWIPGLSVLVNTYLILKLSYATWIRFIIWLAIGLVIYIYCLITGRADKVYGESEEEFKNQKRNISKVSIHGIDNPALDYEDEDNYSSLNNKEKENTKSNGNQMINEQKLITKNILANNNGSPVHEHEKIEQVRNVSASPFDSTQAIHEINQKVLNGVQVPQSSLILASEEDKPRPTKVAFQNHPSEEAVKQPEAEEEPLNKASPVPPEALASILAAHEIAQKCLNGETIPNNNSDKETENAKEIVHAVIHEAESQATQEHTRDAENFVDQILALATERAASNSNSTPPPSPETEIPSDPNPYVLPPFVLKMNEKNNDHQERLDQLVQNNDKDLIQFTEGSDVLQHIHRSCQDVISGKPAVVQPLLLSPQQRQTFLKEMSQHFQNLMDGSKDIPIIISDSDTEPSPQSKENQIPPEFLAAILAAHEIAQKELKPTYSIEKIHQVIVQTLSNKNKEGGKIPICTVTPEMRKEVQQFAQQYMSDPKNQIQKEDAGHLQQQEQQSSPLSPDDLKAAALEIQRIHEIIVKFLAPPDPLEKIHQVCQQTLLKDGEKLPLVLSTRSQRQENKDIVKKLTREAILQSQIEQQENEAPAQALPPPSPSAEQIQQLLAIHQSIQDCLNSSKTATATAPKTVEKIEEQETEKKNPLENLQEIHQVVQRSLQGADSSNLTPVLSNDEERKEIQTLNKKLTQEAFDGEVKVNSSQLVDPDPLPPHILRQSTESMNRLHQRIQESLNDKSPISTTTTTKTPKKDTATRRVVINTNPGNKSDSEGEDDSGYARIDSFVLFTPATPPIEGENDGDFSSRGKKSAKKVSLSPPKFSEEPVYAQVQKPKKTNKDESRVQKTSVSFSEPLQSTESRNQNQVYPSTTENDEEEEEEEPEPVKRSLSNRRPTGPFLPQLNKLKIGSNGFGYGSITDEDEEEEEEEEEENSDSQSQSPSELTESSTRTVPDSGNDKPLEEEKEAVVTRRKSSQTKTVGDLISVFEKGHIN